MRSLSAADLMQAWERAYGQPALHRALTLLAACWPDTDVAALPIGQRDARLLQVYEHLFGPALEAFAECPKCAERLEYSLSARELGGRGDRGSEGEGHGATTADDGAGERDAGEGLTLVSGDLSLRVRLPNSLDLFAASRCGDVATARQLLLERCVLSAQRRGDDVPVRSLPQAAVEEIEAFLAKTDPQAETLIDLSCPACGHGWTVALDIGSFLWTRWNALAKRLLREVHVLARAYGWREPDILALSWIRRQAYLEMASA